MKEFNLINDGSQLPVLCYSLSEKATNPWTLYDLSDRLRMRGWQVPTYPLPKDLDSILVQRIVIREDLGINLAHEFIEDLKASLTELDNSQLVFHKEKELKDYGFTH
ncbi:PLP-dependent aminotransferase family protein [Enterococcus rivorum]